MTIDSDHPLEIRWPDLSECSFRYESIADAFAAAGANVRGPRAEADARRIRGAVILDIWWTQRSLHFILSNGLALRVYLREFFTEWEVLPTAEVTPPLEQIPLASPPITTLFHGLCGSGTTTRDWAGLLRARVGATMHGLYAGHVWLHVYFEGMMLLSVGAWERCRDGELFLAWIEDD